jgi:hypothetical protein
MDAYQPAYPIGQPVPPPGQPAAQQQQLSPETVQAILQLNAQQGQQQQIQRQMQQAQALRQQSMQQAPNAQAGGGRVGAPNWAGTLANIYAAKKAKGMQDEADANQTSMDTQRQAALRRYFEELTGRRTSTPQTSYMGEEGE